MKEAKMKTEQVYSKIFDNDIQKHIMESPIWANCEHSDDISNIDLMGWYCYSIKFDGLTPVQCTEIKKFK